MNDFVRFYWWERENEDESWKQRDRDFNTEEEMNEWWAKYSEGKPRQLIRAVGVIDEYERRPKAEPPPER